MNDAKASEMVGAGASASGDAGSAAKSFDTILMATDLSARSDRALERAIELASGHGAKLNILHVLDENLPQSVRSRVAEAANAEVDDCLSRLPAAKDVETTVTMGSGTDYLQILDQADGDDCDLIVMGIHRNEATRLRNSGTTLERVIRKGKQPVLVVPGRVKQPYARVMIAVDFSVYSRQAIRHALAIAPTAAFSIVHAFQVPFEGLQPGAETRRAVKDEHEQLLAGMIDEELDNLVGAATGDADGELSIERIVRHGDARSVLRAEVEDAAPDLLVLGTHGRAGLSHALLGSVAEDFLNDPPCDVLVVKAW